MGMFNPLRPPDLKFLNSILQPKPTPFRQITNNKETRTIKPVMTMHAYENLLFSPSLTFPARGLGVSDGVDLGDEVGDFGRRRWDLGDGGEFVVYYVGFFEVAGVVDGGFVGDVYDVFYLVAPVFGEY